MAPLLIRLRRAVPGPPVLVNEPQAARPLASLFLSATDTLGTTDSALLPGRGSVQVFTGIPGLALPGRLVLGRSRAFVTTFPRTASDTLGTTDAAGRTAALTRTTADSLGTTDAAVSGGAQTRTASDTLATSDTATRAALSRVRTAADTLGTTDAATIPSSTTLAAAILADGPKRFYKLNEASGTLDDIGLDNADISTIVDAPLYGQTGGIPSTSDTAIFYDGVNDSHTIASAPLIADNGSNTTAVFSVMVVAKVGSAAADNLWYCVLTSSLSSSPLLGFINRTGGKVGFWYRNAANSNSELDSPVGTDYRGAFHLLHVTCDGTTLRLYVDGTEVANGAASTFAHTGLTNTDFDRLALNGLWRSSHTNFAPVTIQYAAWFDTALSPTRVTAHKAAFDGAAGPTARTAADTLGTTDAVARTALLSRTAADSLATSDTVAATRVFARVAGDTLGTTDTASRAALQRARTASDSLGTSDTATQGSLGPSRSAADTLGTSDATARVVVLARTAGDTLATSDTVARAALTLARTATDTLGTTDVATRATLLRSRTATDTLGTSDAVTVVQGGGKTAADTLGTTDTVVRAALLRTRAATDTLGTSDSASKVTTRQRTAADTLGTSDAASRAAQAFLRAALDNLDNLGTLDTVIAIFSPLVSPADQIPGRLVLVTAGSLNGNAGSLAPSAPGTLR